MTADGDFTEASIEAVRASFDVCWSSPTGRYSMGYPTFVCALEVYDQLCAALSVTHASVWEGDRCIEAFDLDPYAWHDPRMLVGR